MGVSSLLELLPLHDIVKSTGGPPKDGVPFLGCPRQHPAEKHKLILIYNPLGENTKLMEFKFEDVLYVESVLSAVTEAGEGVPLVKLWVRRGAHGVVLEPFEVDEPVQFRNKAEDLRELFLRTPAP
jgi:hypothetical protein